MDLIQAVLSIESTLKEIRIGLFREQGVQVKQAATAVQNQQGVASHSERSSTSSGAFSVENKLVLNELSFPWIVSWVQLATGVMISIPAWALGLRHAPQPRPPLGQLKNYANAALGSQAFAYVSSARFA